MIYLPPPQPVSNKDIRISGDVEIHPTASLAPGVILQAAPNCHIVIGADVCIGMGVIINACQGSVEIDSGAILGSGVLIIGACKIGNNSCIGTSTTIFQTNVAAMAVIEPGSIMGDASRQVNLDQSPQSKEKQPDKSSQATKNGRANQSSVNNDYWASEPGSSTVDNSSPKQSSTPSASQVEEVVASVEPQTQLSKPKPPVVGQVYINELLITLFPHSKGLNSNSQNST